MGKRAVLYARVSTDEQAERGYSLVSQLEACRNYAAEHGYVVLDKEHEVIDEHTGAKLDRPGLERIRVLIERREIDAVIVYTADRLSRNLAHSILLREEWKRAEIELHYVSRGKSEDTAEGRLSENIEGVIAEYEREKIRERSVRGKLTKAKSGRWTGASDPPYGYSREGKNSTAHLVVDEYEASIVRHVFNLFIREGLSEFVISQRLNKEGVPASSLNRKRANPARQWWHGTVHGILRRRLYIGEWEYAGVVVPMPHLAIIERKIFDAAQTCMRMHKENSKRNRRHEFLVGSRIRCSCGARMYGRKQTDVRIYYGCALHSSGRSAECDERYIRANPVDTLVWSWLKALLTEPKRLRTGLEALMVRQKDTSREKRDRLALLGELIEKTQKRIKLLAHDLAQMDGEAGREAIKAEMQTVSKQIDALGAERDRLSDELEQGEITTDKQAQIMEWAAEIQARLVGDDIEFKVKRRLIEWLDVRVQVEWCDGKRGIRISCALPIKAEWLSVDGAVATGSC